MSFTQFFTMQAAIKALALALMASGASAQSSVGGGASVVPQPQAASASQVVPAYRSAFEGYRPFSDETVSSWREANDRVREIGGWRAYAKEIQAEPIAPTKPTVPPADGTPAPSPSRTTGGHAGHH